MSLTFPSFSNPHDLSELNFDAFANFDYSFYAATGEDETDGLTFTVSKSDTDSVASTTTLTAHVDAECLAEALSRLGEETLQAAMIQAVLDSPFVSFVRVGGDRAPER